MARFTNGWIKLWRKAGEGDLAQNVYLWGIWHWLLYAATWKPTKVLWNGQLREIPAGSVVFGIRELAGQWNCSTATISKWLKYLNDTGRIALETCTAGCLATICKWEEYQARDEEPRTEGEHEVNTARTRSERDANLIEEDKKERSNTPSAEEEFEQIYLLYPKRKGTQRKQAALASFRKNFKTPEKVQSLTAAIRAYSAECSAEKKHGTPYVMQIATFLNGPWEEYASRPAAQSGGKLKTLEELDEEIKRAGGW